MPSPKSSPALARWSRRPRVLVILGVVVLVLLGGGLLARSLTAQTPLQDALALVPAASQRVSFTDWAAVRTRVGTPEVQSGSATAARLETLVRKGYDLDLTSASTLVESAGALAENYGFSPGNARWEAYAQSGQGAAMVLRVEDDVDLDAVARRLDRLGYDRPGRSEGDTGVWDGGADLVAGIDATITPALQYVALDRDAHLVVTSDDPSYAARAMRVVQGDAADLAGSDRGERVAGLAGEVGEVASAVVWSGDFACRDLSMSQAAPEDEAVGRRLADRAGGVSPLTGLVIAASPARTVTVAMGYENDGQARKDLRPRAELAVAADPSRPSPPSDTFRLTRSRSEGPAVLLTLTPRQRTGFGVSTLTSGPLLMVTC